MSQKRFDDVINDYKLQLLSKLKNGSLNFFGNLQHSMVHILHFNCEYQLKCKVENICTVAYNLFLN